jgi:tetratricopeptide (TPR) repeat protein
LEPKFAPAFIARGAEYLDKKEYDRAIDDYTQALLTEPVERTVAYAFIDRCWARFLAGRDLHDALADCTKALNLRPNDAWTLNARGFIYLKLGEFDRSIADFDAALVNSKMADRIMDVVLQDGEPATVKPPTRIWSWRGRSGPTSRTRSLNTACNDASAATQ